MPAQQRHAFAGMIGARPGGIAAVIGRNQQQVVIAHRAQDIGQEGVEIAQRLGIARHIAAMAVGHVKVHQVHKAQARELARQIVHQ